MLGANDRPNVVVGATEHKAISAAAALGAKLTGGQVRVARVDRSGVVDLDHLDELLDDSVSVVAVMAANNETGVIAPLAEVSEAVESGRRTSLRRYHPVGRERRRSRRFSEHADIMVGSSHKIYGPKGAGALIASRLCSAAIGSVVLRRRPGTRLTRWNTKHACDRWLRGSGGTSCKGTCERHVPTWSARRGSTLRIDTDSSRCGGQWRKRRAALQHA